MTQTRDELTDSTRCPLDDPAPVTVRLSKRTVVRRIAYIETPRPCCIFGSMKHRLLALVPAFLVVVTNLAACSGPGPASTGQATTPASSTVSHSAGVPYSLYTHCGISEAKIDATYYVADTPLSDGNGNPPDGWGNPYQAGTITTPEPSVAIFHDDLGHTVRFHARRDATGFLKICS